MITNKKELKEYINADFQASGMEHPFIASLTYGENAFVRKYLVNLRKTEYWKNRKGLLSRVMYALNLLKHRRLSLKCGMYIAPNTLGKGVNIPHPGFIRISGYCKVGAGATILPMVLFGKKKPVPECSIVVGDNCYISTGVTILGPITIGNNVTIAAGAVVNKDVPDNAIVAGVPAKIIKIKDL